MSIAITGSTVEPLDYNLTVLGAAQTQNRELSDSWPAAPRGVTNSDWKHHDPAAQRTRGRNKGVDFLIDLQLVEQFTPVKNVKRNKIGETLYLLHLVINRHDKVMIN